MWNGDFAKKIIKQTRVHNLGEINNEPASFFYNAINVFQAHRQRVFSWPSARSTDPRARMCLFWNLASALVMSRLFFPEKGTITFSERPYLKMQYKTFLSTHLWGGISFIVSNLQKRMIMMCKFFLIRYF